VTVTEPEQRKLLGAYAADVCMDRQQLMALVLVFLMVFSSLAYAVSVI
jgi:hypothetical protein